MLQQHKVSKTGVNKYTNRSTNISCACYGGNPGGIKVPMSADCPTCLGQYASKSSYEVDGWLVTPIVNYPATSPSNTPNFT